MADHKFVGIRIDIETRSGTDIKQGVYRYTEDPDFAVLIISYMKLWRHRDGVTRPDAVHRVDLNNTADVALFKKIISEPRFQKHAFNANFERICLSRWLGMGTGDYLDPENWHCSAVRANVNGVFGSLDEVAKAVQSPMRKDPEGARLIKLFSVKDRKTGKFHEGQNACWCGTNHIQDFWKFGNYCDQDVLTEAGIASKVPDIPTEVQAEYEADQRINDRGVRHHRKLSAQAVKQVEFEKERLMGELKDLTGLDNPNSVVQFRGWLDKVGYPMTSLAKEFREEALRDPIIPEDVERALTLKGAASLSSVAKHKAALDTRSRDGRIRGSLRFYGAHTGREAGRGIQPQNLPRYEAPVIDRHRLLLGAAGADAPQIAKGTVRASLVPAKGHEFVVADYNAIEARCLGWLAGEKWVQDEFTLGQGKIYEATAAVMFGEDKDKLISALKLCGKCGTCAWCSTRSKAKVANLGLGYGGGAGALVTMGAEEAGIDIGNYLELHREWEAEGTSTKFHDWHRDEHDYPELLRLRDLYRSSSPATVRFWKHCARAWDVAATGKGARFGQNQVVSIIRDGPHNRAILPSGRSIWYRHAKIQYSRKYPDRVDRRTFIGKAAGVGHHRTDTHGGKLTENLTQAVARDVLFDLIMRIEAKTAQGWPGRIVLHVHDEVVLEVPKEHSDQVMADVLGMMAIAPTWGKGLAVKGEGSIMTRYGK